MRKLMTYPVGLILKTYMAYAFFLVEREKRRALRIEKAAAKGALSHA